MDSLQKKSKPEFRTISCALADRNSIYCDGRMCRGILGMRPDFYGLRIAPSIPKEWEKFEISKDFRGCHLHITVKNPGHVEAGCKNSM